MVRSRIIPSLLLKGEILVKTVNFSDRTIYVGDPINAVRIFSELKVDELCLFDIQKRKQGLSPNFSLLGKIAKNARMPLCYGGGIRSASDAINLVNLGFEKISISYSGVQDCSVSIINDLIDKIGGQSVVITLDVVRIIENGYTLYKVRYNNKNKMELYDLDGVLLILKQHAIAEIIINDVDREGGNIGIDTELLEQALKGIDCHLTILGGAQSHSEIASLAQKYSPIGIAAASVFTFTGKHRAVLLNYIK